MEIIKFSDFLGGNYGEYVDKRSFQDTLRTMLLAMLIVYFAPLAVHSVIDIANMILAP